jgi:hypothetical protein
VSSLLLPVAVLTALVALLLCAAAAYVAWQHPAAVAPMTLALGVLGVLTPVLLAAWRMHR